MDSNVYVLPSGRYRVKMSLSGRQRHIGTFDCKLAARQAAINARRQDLSAKLRALQ
jgi:hypothetical protein